MSFISSFDISASAMTAERQRLDVASENIANMNTTRTASGGPYRRKMVVLHERPMTSFRSEFNKRRGGKKGAPNGGVEVTEILEDRSDLKPVYDPEHPDANAEGYVMLPNVDLVKEVVDSMSATRSYEANVTAFNAMKLMAQKALDIGK